MRIKINMSVQLSKYAGFCPGVKAADKRIRSLITGLDSQNRVYTLGELIHNKAVVEKLKGEGIIPAKTPEEIPVGATAVIRSHGVPPQV